MFWGLSMVLGIVWFGYALWYTVTLAWLHHNSVTNSALGEHHGAVINNTDMNNFGTSFWCLIFFYSIWGPSKGPNPLSYHNNDCKEDMQWLGF